MAESADLVYKVKSDNTADTTPISVAVVNDGTADRQVVVLGAGDGSGRLNDGSSANPLNVKGAEDISTVAGAPVATTADGTQLVSLAGPLGDPIDTKGNALRVSLDKEPIVLQPTPAVAVSGSLATATQSVVLGPFNAPTVQLLVDNRNSTNPFVTVEGSLDGINFMFLPVYFQKGSASPLKFDLYSGTSVSLPQALVMVFWVPSAGFSYIRVKITSTSNPAIPISLSTVPYQVNVAQTLDISADAQGLTASPNHAGVNPVIGEVYNGTNFDRMRSAVGATAAGTGVLAASIAPTTAQLGLTKFRNIAVSNTAVAVKASAGRMYKLHAYNPNTADVFLQFYDLAQGSVTVGTTTPDWTYWVPATGAVDLQEVLSLSFATAISIAVTTTIAGGTAPGTGALVNIGYI